LIQWSLACHGFPRSAFRICSSLDILAAEWGVSRGRFEAFFTAGLRLPAHRFVVEVLQRFEVLVHQLTPNAMVALAKYV
jgi:hypothetical protein